MRAEDVIVGRQRERHADRRRFLADREVRGTGVIVGDALVGALRLDLVEHGLELADGAHVLPDVQQVLGRVARSSSSASVLSYAFTGMSRKRMTSRVKTRSGSMTMDLGMGSGQSSYRHSHDDDRIDSTSRSSARGLQKSRAGGAVDDLMVARERQADGVDELDAAGGAHRLHLDGADAEDRDLRRVEQRRERFDAQGSQVADREGRAGESSGRDRALDSLSPGPSSVRQSSPSDSCCASRTTGAIRPRGVSHAKPRCTCGCLTSSPSMNSALTAGSAFSARMRQKVTR